MPVGFACSKIVAQAVKLGEAYRGRGFDGGEVVAKNMTYSETVGDAFKLRRQPTNLWGLGVWLSLAVTVGKGKGGGPEEAPLEDRTTSHSYVLGF